jgi:hypothetical protein
MNLKKAKKIRQEFRREFAKSAREMGERVGNAMKPKPRFIPWRLWLWGAGIFIKIKKQKNG